MSELVDLSVRVVEEEQSLPEGVTARQFLQMVMRGEIDPEPKQMNAAKVLIEYEEPKLSAVAVGHMDGISFAQALERAIERSKQPPPKAALLPPPQQHSPEELKKPFAFPRRNLR
jgi:hypothetical protein